MLLRFGVLVALSALLLLGCNGLWECEDMERVVKDISKDNRYATGGSPIEEIELITEISRTEQRVNCEGLAWLENGQALPIGFHQYYNEDGEMMTGFKVLP